MVYLSTVICWFCKYCTSRYFTQQQVELEIAISYLTRGGVFLETTFHESVAGVEYGFQKHSSQRKIWSCYLIFHKLMSGVSYIHHIIYVFWTKITSEIWKKLSGVSVDIWIEEGRQLPRALPKWTVSPPLSKNLLVQCFFYKYGTKRFVGKDACTVQTITGMRAQPKIHCETESSQGAYGAVKYLLCTTLCTPVHLYFNVMEQIDITDIHCSDHCAWTTNSIYSVTGRIFVWHLPYWSTTSAPHLRLGAVVADQYGECHTQILPVKEYII